MLIADDLRLLLVYKNSINCSLARGSLAAGRCPININTTPWMQPRQSRGL